MANRFDVDPDLVQKLADLLDRTGLTEIEYESAGRRIRVSRQAGVAAASPAAAAAPAPAGVNAEAPAPDAPRRGTPVTSPMVGTVYLAPEPGAEPFVRVGDSVTEGQTIMLIEAMKTYNPVRAPRAGKVIEILVGDVTPVEFGEELLLLE